MVLDLHLHIVAGKIQVLMFDFMFLWMLWHRLLLLFIHCISIVSILYTFFKVSNVVNYEAKVGVGVHFYHLWGVRPSPCWHLQASKNQLQFIMLESYFFQATCLSASIILNTPTLGKFVSRGVSLAQQLNFATNHMSYYSRHRNFNMWQSSMLSIYSNSMTNS